MFCPNCGSPNPETAPSCAKCGTQLKQAGPAAAPPKFKGTMLMMNQPAGGSAAPPVAGPPGAPVAGPGAPVAGPGAGPGGVLGPPPAAANKLKGTMVGVAPPMAGAAPAPPPPPPFEAAPPAPVPEPVNPLGGTFVASDAGGFGGFPPPAGLGAPPPQQYGAPPGQDPNAGFGAPPPQQQYGAPPGDPNAGFGAPPPQQPYGAPPGDPNAGYGAPQGQPGGQPGYGQAPPQDYGQQAAQGFNQAGNALGQAGNEVAGAFGMAPYGGAAGAGMAGFNNAAGGMVPAGEKSWMVTLILCWLPPAVGFCGIHRFYTGHIWQGVVQLLTFGACGIWQVIDLFMIFLGKYTDAQGRPLKKGG